MTEPVALADLKAHLRLDPGATDEDAYLTSRIVAARRACEKQIDRSIVGAVDVLVLDSFPGQQAPLLAIAPLEAINPRARDIALAGGAVASITSIAYVDALGAPQQLAAGGYVADLAETPAILAPIGAWPAVADQPGAVTITYVVSSLGADDLAVVAMAMLLLIGGWYRNRESVQVDGRGAPAEIPLSVGWLLEPLRQWPTE